MREDLAGGVQRGFDVRAGAGAETLRELTIPGVARRLGRVGETSPQLIEVPVALELVLIEAAIRLVENFDRRGVVRFISIGSSDLEATALQKMIKKLVDEPAPNPAATGQ